MENTSKSWIAWIIGIIVVILIGWGINLWLKSSNYSENLAPVTDNGAVRNDMGNKLVVEDQVPGKVVYVTLVSLQNGGFVVIMKNNNVIGSKYFPAGINPGSVDLTQSTTEGESYTAVLYNDSDDSTIDSDDSTFSIVKNTPILDNNGQKIQTTFKTTKNLQGLPS